MSLMPLAQKYDFMKQELTLPALAMDSTSILPGSGLTFLGAGPDLGDGRFLIASLGQYEGGYTRSRSLSSNKLVFFCMRSLSGTRICRKKNKI